jgi:ring-1,2-phenylacetyl-CoA epoxidase subunit PaaC
MNEWPLWEIFIRSQHGLAHRHVGSLHAPDAEMAIKNARDVYTRRNEGVSIWAVKSADVVASAPGDQEPLFEPANSKVYRHPTFFPMPDEVKHLDRSLSTLSRHDRDERLFQYLLRLGDSPLILAQRLGEWVGHGPILEEDIAQTNVGLDLLGQARMWLSYAGEVEARFAPIGRSEDELAFLRDSGEFRNLLLAEQPNGNFADTVARQFLFDAWHLPLLGMLACSRDSRIAEIAAKAAKEAAYHVERSADWVIRLGDGTDESHAKMQAAIDDLWMYTGEMFTADTIELALIDAGIAADGRALAAPWREHVDEVLRAATIKIPPTRSCSRAASAGRTPSTSGTSCPRCSVVALASGSAMVIAAPTTRPTSA